jgi:hypothetical protein
MASSLCALSLHPSEVETGFVLVLETSVPGTISSAKSRSAAARASLKPVDKRLPFWNQRPLPHCEHFISRGSTLSGAAPRCLQLGQMIAISMDLLNSAIMSGGQGGGSCFSSFKSWGYIKRGMIDISKATVFFGGYHRLPKPQPLRHKKKAASRSRPLSRRLNP